MLEIFAQKQGFNWLGPNCLKIYGGEFNTIGESCQIDFVKRVLKHARVNLKQARIYLKHADTPPWSVGQYEAN